MTGTVNWYSRVGLVTISCFVLLAANVHAQEGGNVRLPQSDSFSKESVTVEPLEGGPAGSAEQNADRAERFAKYMTGAKFVGRFTVHGSKEEKYPQETYTITKCEVLEEPNVFRFTARIQYGDTDSELPMELPVVWAGDTPVISLTNLWIPGLGTFSSRVVIYQGSYAGTWKHGEKGGHLFGSIEKAKNDGENGDAETSSTITVPELP